MKTPVTISGCQDAACELLERLNEAKNENAIRAVVRDLHQVGGDIRDVARAFANLEEAARHAADAMNHDTNGREEYAKQSRGRAELSKRSFPTWLKA